MAKRGAGTLLEKHGFADHDLYDSKHDEICGWVDDNAAALLKEDLKCVAEKVTAEWEFPLPHCVGFVDLMLFADGNVRYYVEVKTRIESIGAILRELQFYRAKTTAPKERIVLVCPHTYGLDRVRKQGFPVITYNPDRFRVRGVKRQSGVFQIQ